LIGVAGGIFGEGEEETAEIREGVILRTQQVKHVLFEGKLVPKEKERWSSRFDTLGTIPLITGKEIGGDIVREFPEWPDEGTDSSFRDTEDDNPVAPFYTQPVNKFIGIVSQPRGTTPSSIPSPIILTPGGPSPAGSVPKPGLAASAASSKPQFMDLDAFFKSDDEASSSESDDEEEGDDATDEAADLPVVSRANTPSSLPIFPRPPFATVSSTARVPSSLGGSIGHPSSAPRSDSEDEDYTDEESHGEDEDAFLRRG